MTAMMEWLDIIFVSFIYLRVRVGVRLGLVSLRRVFVFSPTLCNLFFWHCSFNIPHNN